MKYLFVLLLGLVAFASCKKEAEPAPVASARVSGTYDVTRYVSRITATGAVVDVTLPRSISGVQVTGTLVAEKFNNRDDAVTMLFTLKAQGYQDDVYDFEDFDLTGTGTTLDLTYQGQKYGTADGNNIDVTVPYTNGSIRVVAKRR